MGFGINLQQLLNIAKMGGDLKHIDKGGIEEAKAKALFQNNIDANDAVGDKLIIKSKNAADKNIAAGINKKANANTGELAYMTNLLKNDPEINPTKLNKYMSQPTSIESFNYNYEIPENVNNMAKLADDVDVDKLNAYLDAAFASGIEDRMNDFTLGFEEVGAENAELAGDMDDLREQGVLK